MVWTLRGQGHVVLESGQDATAWQVAGRAGEIWSLAPVVSAVCSNETCEWSENVSTSSGRDDPDEEGVNSHTEVFLKVPLLKQAENDSLLNLKGLDQQSKNLAQKKAFP